MTARPQDVALLPCPFCGEPANLHAAEDEDSTHWWAQCSVCGAVAGDRLAESTPDREFAIAAWNTRANLSAALASAQAREEELRAAMNAALDQVIKFRDARHAAEARAERLAEALRDEAALLRAWARESREGGWSTHQHDPMIRRATELEALSTNAAQPGETT